MSGEYLKSFLLNMILPHRPVSRLFGTDRGIPIDRYYIESFLSDNRKLIKGAVLEIADDFYIKKFGSNVDKTLVLHTTADAGRADIIGDLASGEGIPENLVDCFILTQTLLCIYDVRSAARNSIRILKPGGHLLLTVPGITQISRYDHERWGHYWSFTDQSLRRLFEEVVPPENILIRTYGNVKAAAYFLYGLAKHEISQSDLAHHDPDYQVTIAAVIKKP